MKEVESRRLTPSTSLIKLFDASSPKVLGADFKEFRQLKLGGEHFSAILERGIEAAVQDRIMPKGDGVSFPDAGVESAFSSALDIVVITDQVEAKLKDALPHAYIFNVETRQRVIELRKDNSQGRTKIRESRPKRRTQSEVVEIPPDLDGGLRFTDGKRVYELVPVLGGTDLVIWEVEHNKLRRF